MPFFDYFPTSGTIMMNIVMKGWQHLKKCPILLTLNTLLAITKKTDL